jgi:DNA repair exonuclease SbcCD ATPase subunit
MSNDNPNTPVPGTPEGGTPGNAGSGQDSQYQRLKRRLQTVVAELEQQRTELEKLKAHAASLEEAKRQAEAKAAELEARASQEQRRAAKVALIARQAPNLLSLADYIPTAGTDEEQVQAIEGFLASLEQVVGKDKRQPNQGQPTGAPPPAGATPPIQGNEMPLSEVQEQLLQAILAGNTEKAAQLNGIYYQLLAQQVEPKNDPWAYHNIVRSSPI